MSISIHVVLPADNVGSLEPIVKSAIAFLEARWGEEVSRTSLGTGRRIAAKGKEAIRHEIVLTPPEERTSDSLDLSEVHALEGSLRRFVSGAKIDAEIFALVWSAP